MDPSCTVGSAVGALGKRWTEPTALYPTGRDVGNEFVRSLLFTIRILGSVDQYSSITRREAIPLLQEWALGW